MDVDQLRSSVAALAGQSIPGGPEPSRRPTAQVPQQQQQPGRGGMQQQQQQQQQQSPTGASQHSDYGSGTAARGRQVCNLREFIMEYS